MNTIQSQQTSSAKLSYKVQKQKRIADNQELKLSINMSRKYLKLNDYNSLVFSASRLSEEFFSKPCISLAKSLLGKIICRRFISGELLKGKIVETESYLGSEDVASHSYQSKKTERNKAMFEKPGTAYVYKIYGVYHCFNISSLEEGSAVLIRSIEPLLGETAMQQLRIEKRKSNNLLKHKELCNGPSKLCQAFKITKEELNMKNLCESDLLWLENGPDVLGSEIIACKRIGIDSYGEEWANKPLRFYIKNCIYVSVKNKQAERDCIKTAEI